MPPEGTASNAEAGQHEHLTCNRQSLLLDYGTVNGSEGIPCFEGFVSRITSRQRGVRI